MATDDKRPVIVVAGGSGFIGTHLRHTLAGKYHWRALTRSEALAHHVQPDDETEWTHCDLYSLPQVEDAMRGADYAIYLVHSMMPSSHLLQGSFSDLDILLADNFVRAAETAGIKHIVYLSGLIPREDAISEHLASRLEVENVLRSRSVPVTVLRTGMVFGSGGSSAKLLINLVRRLPLMILPKWTTSKTQTIDIRDVVRAFDIALNSEELHGKTYDLASHELTTYEQLILDTASVLGKKPRTFKLPFNVFVISWIWVAYIGRVPPELAKPLIKSLKHDLVTRDNPLLRRIRHHAIPFQRSVRESVDPQGQPQNNPRSISAPIDAKLIERQKRVRSVQRMQLPDGWDAVTITDDFGNWLTKIFASIVWIDHGPEGILRFKLKPFRVVLLELVPTPFSKRGQRRRAFYITGGLLVRTKDYPRGRLEFRVFPKMGILIAAIHGFPPRLPWWFYSLTQARIHLWIMNAYARRLKRIVRAQQSSTRELPHINQ